MNTAIMIKPTKSRLAGPSGGLEVLEIRLPGAASGLVVLLTAAGGLDGAAAETMNAFAEHGYASIAVDLAANGQRDRNVVGDLGKLVDHAVADGWELDQIALVGYGAGGRAALLGAMSLDVAAAVSVSPSDAATVRPTVRSTPMQTPWLGMFGEGDTTFSSAGVLALYGHLCGFSAAHVGVVCYEAGADFYRDSADPVVHAAAFDCWQRTVEWLTVRVAPRLTPLAVAWRARSAHGTTPA